MTKLKEIREKKGITQRELSNICKISIKTIMAYEQGFRSINSASCSTVKK